MLKLIFLSAETDAAATRGSVTYVPGTMCYLCVGPLVLVRKSSEIHLADNFWLARDSDWIIELTH